MELPNGLPPLSFLLVKSKALIRFRVSDSYSHAYYKPFFGFHDSSYFKIPRFIRKLLNYRLSPVVQDSGLTIPLDGQSI